MQRIFISDERPAIKCQANRFKIVFINNSAPRVHIPKRGKVFPDEVISVYFQEKGDAFLSHPAVLDLLSEYQFEHFSKPFKVITWQHFMREAIATMIQAQSTYDDEGIKRLFQNSIYSMEWYLQRRLVLLGEKNNDSYPIKDRLPPEN